MLFEAVRKNVRDKPLTGVVIALIMGAFVALASTVALAPTVLPTIEAHSTRAESGLVQPVVWIANVQAIRLKYELSGCSDGVC